MAHQTLVKRKFPWLLVKATAYATLKTPQSLCPTCLWTLTKFKACWYGTAQFKLDTRVQQTRVHLTDFVKAHASCSHAGCMAREHMHNRIHCPRTSIHSTRHARATPRGTPKAYRM